ncbi:MAG TPA: (2Fe-2S) ferredoxin domain-containing protein [Bacteroidales bacterium]|mgnify:CR=1 FL=1|nr:(2Fe-2S) ferredoxin domain-containing protein [Bacteroidales bacterium]OQB63666.1 MAG: NADH dehydrogenase subunit E [Bacteroidetes bacterium ADurb.Bin145]NMD03144.1 (2Fe-2S) ferredoxin domain-containing protein [Bacteroidales bacterium]HOU01281.1 (2Fe-2S) ferredoxin domain-containing protein [Bacteroidales bacterium]HQG63403.1 (2Fe-2S) ferredoxin domain-containing protein [Bacteroidales bacterium]
MSQAKVLHICLGSSCFSRGNKDLVAFIKEYLKKNHLEDKVVFKGARCMGNCSKGPNMKIGEDILIEGITLTGIEQILDREFSRLK